ncbi:MAG: MerR family transcriptional regulator [Lachnospiraceae bacterium]|nr:MerR family transcriptional regulator [Lachnospiraceae bacterium]
MIYERDGAMKVSEFSKRLGIAPSKVRYYDRFGMYQGGRCTENNYREFTREDALDVYNAQLLRSFDMSMKESVQTIREFSLGQIAGWLDEHIEELDEEIRLANIRLARLQQMRRYYTEIPGRKGEAVYMNGKKSYSICTFGDCARIDDEILKIAACWGERMPFTYVALTIPAESLLGGQERLSVGAGLGILEENYFACPLPVSGAMDCFPEGPCLTVFLERENPFALTRTDIKPLFELAQKKKLRIVGGATGRIFLSYQKDGGRCHGFSVRVRVEPDK